jgi:hypothetical protein
MVDGENGEGLAWIALATALAGLRTELQRARLDPVVPLAVVAAMGALDAVLLNLGHGPVVGVPRVGSAELLADARSALTLLIDNVAWELPIDRVLLLARAAPVLSQVEGVLIPGAYGAG